MGARRRWSARRCAASRASAGSTWRRTRTWRRWCWGFPATPGGCAAWCERVGADAGGACDVLVHAWCPADGIRRRAQRDHAPYDAWARQGFLEATEGDAVDQELIRERILEYAAEFDIREIGFDDWNMGYLGPKLLADGVNLKPIRQTFKALSGATKHLERCVLRGTLRHGGQPVLRWCIANTVVMKDGPENIKPSKEKSTERIDLTVALVMALEGAGTARGPSVDEQRGVVAL